MRINHLRSVPGTKAQGRCAEFQLSVTLDKWERGGRAGGTATTHLASGPQTMSFLQGSHHKPRAPFPLAGCGRLSLAWDLDILFGEMLQNPLIDGGPCQPGK